MKLKNLIFRILYYVFALITDKIGLTYHLS